MSFQCYVSIKGKTQQQFKAETKKTGRSDKWMEFIEFEMGSSVPVDANSGEPKGFRQHKPLVVTKERGAASPQILQAHWKNEILTEVVLEIVGRSDDGAKEIVQERITLKDAIIVSVNRYSHKSAKDVKESDMDYLEDIAFRYRQIMVENPAAGTSTSDDWNEPGA
ncbi:MAG: type VI secretion system tube protein Hcp [Polyangiaceae bacterium]|nr:type VI secretion system tube protein Hcp [Polyangiaceae bacterium]